MNTSTTTITETPAVTNADGTLTATGWAEEARYIRAALSDEAVNAIRDYEYLLAHVFACSPANKDNDSIDMPGFDAALRHALKAATKASRAELKAVRGQWALRKVMAARKASRASAK